MFKNATPRQLATYSAFSIGLAYLIVSFVLSAVLQSTFQITQISIATILVVLISYLVVFYFLKIFIYRKVKLIYKIIHRLKLTSSDKSKAMDIDMDEDIISKIQAEVSTWAEDQQKEILQLKSMEDYRRNFLGNVSHELKTPIFTIQGYILTLLEGGIYDERINIQFLKKAAKGVSRLQTIVEDLDIITRLESGRLELEMSSFSIKDLADEVIEELDLLAEEKNISMVYKAGAEGNFKVLADREKIRQVLSNLLSNAIKYGKQNGQAKVGFYDMGTNILLEVADNGLGIDEEHIPHLFDRFYRVDSSRSRDEGGSGLGLAIVKHIIEAHRQTINVRSKPGLGSTFGITLEKTN